MRSIWTLAMSFIVAIALTGSVNAADWDDYPLQRRMWQRHYEAPWHYPTGQYVYYNPSLTASSAPYSFWEKPKVKRSCCEDPCSRRKVRTYKRRVVYQPAGYYRGNCCSNRRSRRHRKSCY